MAMTVQEQFRATLSKWMEGYADAYADVAATQNFKNTFRDVVSNEVPDIIRKIADISAPYTVVGSYGKGRWTAVPWVAIFDTRITSSAQHGVYIVYLLNKDTKELFLTFEIAATEAIQNPTGSKDGPMVFTGLAGKINEKAADRLQSKADEIRSAIPSVRFASDAAIKTGSQGYDSGAVYYKKYTLIELPTGDILADDLREMMKLYQTYYELFKATKKDEEWLPPISEYTPGISKEGWLDLLRNPSVFTPDCLEAMACMVDNGGYGSCTELASKYHQQMTLYRTKCGVHLAKRIAQETACPVYTFKDKQRFYTIPFQYRKTSSDEEGSYIYRLRNELAAALNEFGILKYLPQSEVRTMDTRDTIAKVKSYIASRGFTYDGNLIENFYLCLKSKPFIILAGTSGTGKTRLARLFAEAIGAECKIVPVRPDWSDSTDLFGHVDLNGHFVPGAVLDFLKNAQDDPGKPYFLCLDEMNLARVEYYMSDFLSIIETRDMKNGVIVSEPLMTADKYGTDKAARDKYDEISFPENLYIVGTVNMDETTFPFSRKVLDRANTIEFSYVDLMPKTKDSTVDAEKQDLRNDFLKTEYLLLAQCDDEEFVGEICAELQQINSILLTANAHVGYRVRDEIVFYMLNNKSADLLPRNAAMDNEIMQKILPRIQGSSASVKDMLCELFKHCAGDYDGYQTASDSTWKKMQSAAEAPGCRYPSSAKKIVFMVRRFEEDGFTSYWL